MKKLSGSASHIWNRRVWAHLRNTNLKVRREDVRRAILQYDPDGVLKRKRRKFRWRKYFSAKPNFLWHIDDHDKFIFYCEIRLGTTIMWICFPLFHGRITSIRQYHDRVDWWQEFFRDIVDLEQFNPASRILVDCFILSLFYLKNSKKLLKSRMNI